MSREWTIADEVRLQQGMTSQVYRQGEVWIADISGGIGHEYGSETDPSKQRPVVILSNNEMSSTQIVAICTTKSKYEFDRRPDLIINSNTGNGAELVPIMLDVVQSVVDDSAIRRPLVGITSVIDCPPEDHVFTND